MTHDPATTPEETDLLFHWEATSHLGMVEGDLPATLPVSTAIATIKAKLQKTSASATWEVHFYNKPNCATGKTWTLLL